MTSRSTPLVFLAAMVALGTFMRFWNLSWDSGLLYHPDEMNMGLAMMNIRLFDHMDPKFYAYNGFSLYLYKFVGTATAWVTKDQRWTTDMGRLLLVGRHLSAIASSLSILLLFVLGKRLAGFRTAFLAASLMACNVGLIQCAHFAVTETLLVLFLLLTALATDWYILGNRSGDPLTTSSLETTTGFVVSAWPGLLLAVILGVAIGTKTSALSFLLFPVTALILTCRSFRELPGTILNMVAGTLVVAGSAFAVSPYSFLNLEAFRASMAYEGGVVHGTVRVPYTIQFTNTIPYLPWLDSLFWFCTPPVAIVGMVGMGVWLLRGVKAVYRNPGTLAPHDRRERLAAIPFLLFGVAYAGYIGSWYAKFVRYLIPLLPVLALGAAWATETVRSRFPRLGTLLVIVLLGGSGVWSACFFSILVRPSSRTAASEWLYDSMPPRLNVLREQYDYPLPAGIPGRSAPNWQFQAFPFQEPDSPGKMRELSRALASSDILILASRRLYSTLPKDQATFPLTSRYYRDLFAGNLGFRLLAEFSSPPGIGPWVFSDDSAEETFQVFDHPTVRVFRKEADPVPLAGTSPISIEAYLTRPLAKER